MKNLLRHLAALTAVFTLGTFTATMLTACEKGPAEEAGDNIDDAVDDAGDALEDAGDEIEDVFDGD
ncbi:MAG: hypothetical protein ACR2GY_05095 [Phycisphaerales bacterium]